MHRSRLAVLGLLLLGAGPAVLAEDIVNFTNGTFLKVQSYTVEGDMIRVVLGPDASMSFPKTLVESVERAGRTIYPQGPTGPANVVTSAGVGGQVSGGGQFLQTGEHQVAARYRRGAAPAAGAEGGEKDGAPPTDPRDVQLPGRRGTLRAVGRRQSPVGEALVEADPTAPPPAPIKPRIFTTIAPKSLGTTVETTPPPEPEDDGAVESDGTVSPD
jgi:cell division septation protein DedD